MARKRYSEEDVLKLLREIDLHLRLDPFLSTTNFCFLK